MGKVVLEYKREHGVGDKKSKLKKMVVGRVLFEPDDGSEEEQTFETEDFAVMMGLYAKALKEHPGAKAFFQRTDRPNMPVYPLDPLTEEGLKERTEETIRRLTDPPPIHIEMGKRIKGKSLAEETDR